MRYAIGASRFSKSGSIVREGVYVMFSWSEFVLWNNVDADVAKYSLLTFASSDEASRYCRYLSGRMRDVRFYPLKADTKEFPYKLGKMDLCRTHGIRRFGQVTFHWYSFTKKNNVGTCMGSMESLQLT